MENKARYTIVGIFVLTFTFAMILFILWLARYDIKEINAKEYRLYSKTSIGGLSKNSIVEYKGINIGVVDGIEIDPKNLEQIEITLKITKPEVIKIDSYAIVQSQGVTGNKIIEIAGGTMKAKILEPVTQSYAIIPLKKSFLDRLTTSADNITSQVETILSKFELILNNKNINNVDQILNNTNSSTKDFNKMLIKINKLIDNSIINTLENVDSMTNSIEKVIKKDVKNAIKRIDTLSNNMNILSNDIKNIVNDDVKSLLLELQKTAVSSQDIDKVLNQLENTLDKIDITVEEFGQSGGDMIFKTRKIKYGPGEKEENE